MYAFPPMPMMTAAPNAEPPPDGSPLLTPPTSPITLTSNVFLSDPPVCTFFSTLLCINIIRSSQEFTDYPIKLFLCNFLQQLKKVNNKSTILLININSSLGCIAMDSDIPSGEKLTKYVDGISHPTSKNATNDNNNMIHFHIHINTTLPLWQMKWNTAFYSWLKSNHVFLCTHGFTTSYDIQSAGFFGNLSPTMHHHNTMKMIIDKAASIKGLNLEICLVPWNIPYGKKEDKMAVTAVEILVNRASVHTIHEMMIEIFQTNKMCSRQISILSLLPPKAS